MKREIKFRAWDGKKMVVPDCTPSKDGVLFLVCTNSEDTPDGFPPRWEYADDVMQYTGLKDKNGKEVWEGDIVTEGLHPYVVEWKEHKRTQYGHGDATTTLYLGYGFNFWGIDVQQVEVLGNIYENPELIEK